MKPFPVDPWSGESIAREGLAEGDVPDWHLPELVSADDSFARGLCPVPDPTDSDRTYARYYHLDLAHMSREELLRERTCLVIRLGHEGSPHPWLKQRFAHVHRMVCRGR